MSSDQRRIRAIRVAFYVAVPVAAVCAMMPAAAPARSAAKKPAPYYRSFSSTAPKKAIPLFTGKDVSQWRSANSDRPAPWRVMDGAMEVGGGNIVSKPRFTDFHLHIEFNIPNMPDARDQGKGNSGVYLQGMYEIQVLDSFNNTTYPNGMCGAIYGQHVPKQNVARQPGDWQSYDILYTAPRLTPTGERRTKARATVYWNSILIHDDVEIDGRTTSEGSVNGRQAGPILLQDHGAKVRYRNIWVLPTTGS